MSENMQDTVETNEVADNAAETGALDDAAQEQPTVSLSDVLDGGEDRAENDAEQAPGADAPAQAEQQPAQTAEKSEQKPATYTQADFDRVIGQRTHAERERVQREYEPDRTLANALRALYPGETPEQITERLLDVHAAALAEKEGTTPEFAKRVLRMEMGTATKPTAQTQTAQQEQKTGAPDMAELTRQAETVQRLTGVNMVEVLKADFDLMGRVSSGEIDIMQAYEAHAAKGAQQTSAATQQQRAPSPPLVRGGRTGAAQVDPNKFSDKDMKTIDEQLRRGKYVALE